jgi:hypothetical protein
VYVKDFKIRNILPVAAARKSRKELPKVKKVLTTITALGITALGTFVAAFTFQFIGLIWVRWC